MAFPRPQIYVQTDIQYLVPASVVSFSRQQIVKAPILFSQFIPRHIDTRLGGSVRKIGDDDVTFLVPDPAPCENIPAALVVGPAAFLTEAPFTVAKDIQIDLIKNTSGFL